MATPGFGPPEPIAPKSTPGFGPPESAAPEDFSDVTSGGATPIMEGGVNRVFGDRAVHPAAVPGLVQTVGHQLQQGLTFGQMDRLSAGLQALTGGDYDKTLAEEQGKTEAEQEAHPVAAPLSNIVGGLASPANPVIGKAIGLVGTPISALAKRFPQIADRLAMRLTNAPAGDVAERILQNAKNPAGAGKFAADVGDMGLGKLTNQGTLEASAAASKSAGDTLGALRAGKGVPVEDVRNLVESLGKGAGVEVPPEAARELQMLVAKLPESGEVSLDQLAQLTQQHVNAPMKVLRGIGSQASPEAGRVLQAGKEGLEQVQRKVIGEAAVPQYAQAQKAYAIANNAAEDTATAMSHPTQSLTKAAIGGSGRTAAYTALKAYNVARSPAAQAIAHVAAKAGPAAASTLAQSADSANPVEQGVALMQAQANDSGAREVDEDPEVKAARENLLRDED